MSTRFQTEKSTRIAEYVEKMKAYQDVPDIEHAHIEADRLLCDLLKSEGYAEVVEAFENVGKWYA